MTEGKIKVVGEAILIKKDDWLSAHFNKNCYGLSLPDDKGQFELPSQLQEPCFASIKIDPVHIHSCHRLQELGFKLVDTNVIFEKIIDSKVSPGYRVRWAEAEDEEVVTKLAKNNFQFTRFHLDSQISKELADEIKGSWAKNFFSGKRGDQMLVAESPEGVQGFLLLLGKSGENLTIDLIAVDQKSQKQGLALEMIHFVELSAGLSLSLKVGTQIANKPSIALYEKAGFHWESASYVFHYHR